MPSNISVRLTIAGLCMYVPDDRVKGAPVMRVLMPQTGHIGVGEHSAHGHPKHAARLLVDPVNVGKASKPGEAPLEAFDIDGQHIDLSGLSRARGMPRLPEEIVDIRKIQGSQKLLVAEDVVDLRPTNVIAAMLTLRGGVFFPGPSRYMEIGARSPKWITGLLDWRLNAVLPDNTLTIDLPSSSGHGNDQSLALTPFDDTIWLILVHLLPGDVPLYRRDMLFPRRTGTDHFSAYYTIFGHQVVPPARIAAPSTSAAAMRGPDPDPYVICSSPKSGLKKKPTSSRATLP